MPWQGRKLGDCSDLADAREHLERVLGLMSELHCDFDGAQLLEALGDINSAVDSQLARSNYSMAAQLYEEGGHLVAAAAAQRRAGQCG